MKWRCKWDIDHIDARWIYPGLDMGTNIVNIETASVSMIMLIYNKQLPSNTWIPNGSWVEKKGCL